MKKRYWFLIFLVGFFVVFAISAVSTFLITLDRDEKGEDATENVYTGGSVLPQGNVIEAETTITRVTPTLTVADAIIVHGIYGENENVYEKPSLTEEQEDTEELFEDVVIDEGEEAEDKAPAPKTEKEEEKAEEPEKEEKKEEVKTEEKKEEPKKEEAKAEEPKKEEAPKVEEKKEEAPAPKVEVEEPKKEEAKPQLNPDIQTSDSGL